MYLYSGAVGKYVCVYSSWQAHKKDAEGADLFDARMGTRALPADAVQNVRAYEFDVTGESRVRTDEGKTSMVVGADMICPLIRDTRVMFAVSGMSAPRAAHVICPDRNARICYEREGAYINENGARIQTLPMMVLPAASAGMTSTIRWRNVLDDVGVGQVTFAQVRFDVCVTSADGCVYGREVFFDDLRDG